MADRMTPLQRSRCMSRIRSKDTGPERSVRRELYRRGFRYRLNCRNLPGTPDIVLHKYRTAIFVNGCFWHGHEGCKSYVRPSSNTGFWDLKVQRNKSRDARDAAHLEALGWFVITIWECELSPSRLQETMDKVESDIRSNRFRYIKEKAASRYRKDSLAKEDHLKRSETVLKTEESLGGTKIPGNVKSLSEKEEGLES